MNRAMSWLIQRLPGFEPAYRRRVAIEKIQTLAREVRREVLIVALSRRVRSEFVDRTMWLLRYRLLQGIRNSRDERNRPFRASEYFGWLYRETFEPMDQTIATAVERFRSDRWIGKLFDAAVIDDVDVPAIEREIAAFYREISADFAVGDVDESTIEPMIVAHFGLTPAEPRASETSAADILRRQHYDLPGYLVGAMWSKREFDQRYRGVSLDALERLTDHAFEDALKRFDPAGTKTFRSFASVEIVDQIHRVLKVRLDLDDFFRGSGRSIDFDLDDVGEILASARQARDTGRDVTTQSPRSRA